MYFYFRIGGRIFNIKGRMACHGHGHSLIYLWWILYDTHHNYSYDAIIDPPVAHAILVFPKRKRSTTPDTSVTNADT
jgi:hypothetical protein